MKTKVITIDPEFPEMDKVAHCAKVIERGGLVVFPTETVYGIAANLENKKAMQRLREVKKRSEDKPFSRLIAQGSMLEHLTPYEDTRLYKLIDRYWPGPLTVIVPSREDKKTIGLRMPDHPIALNLICEASCPIAAPSANLEGQPPPTTLQEAIKDFDGLVEVAIDGGPARIGRGSTIVDFVPETPKVVREGIIKEEAVDRVLKRKCVLFVCTGNSCRSVMAEYLLKKKIEEREDVEVISAGTSVFVQAGASVETLQILRKESVDVAGHVSRPLTNILLRKADLIFVMTKAHRHQVLTRVPQVEKRIYLLKEFSKIPKNFEGDLDIPDPIGRPSEVYEECLITIKEAVLKIAELV